MSSDPTQPPDDERPSEAPAAPKPDDSSKTTDSQGKGKGPGWLPAGRLASTGIELGLTIAVLVLLGWWLDDKWQTTPWLTLTGAVIATVGCTYKMLRISAAMDDKRKSR